MKNIFKALGNINLAHRAKTPLFIIAIITIMVFSFTSCGSTTSPTVNYSYPDTGVFSNNDEIAVKDYVTLGIIFVKSSEVIDGSGNHTGSKITYEMLMLEAQKLGADDVINIRIDINREEEFAPGERLPFKITFNYTASALAIKYTTAIVPSARATNPPQTVTPTVTPTVTVPQSTVQPRTPETVPVVAEQEIEQEPVIMTTALEIEILLNTRSVTYGQAVRFVLEASAVLATDSPQEAFDYAVEQHWLPSNVSADTNARLDKISLLLMQSFGMSGGVMYTITKSSRYAYRELVYNNVIQGRRDSSMPVSGEELLYYVNRILDMREGMSGVIQERDIIEEQADGENAVSEN